MVADELDYVIGVDTHLDEHVLAVIAAPSGVVVAQRSIHASARGYAAALRFAADKANGAASGRSRARAATAPASPVSSLAPARRCSRSAARQGPSGACAAKTTPSTPPGQRGRRLRARRSRFHAAGNGARRCGCCWSRVAAPSTSAAKHSGNYAASSSPPRTSSAKSYAGFRSEGCSTAAAACAAHRSASADELATRLVLRSLARRIQAATLEAAELERELLGHIRALAPPLLEEPGVGPIVAAQLIVAWSHPGRLRSEAAFARLAGVAPVPASSGKTTRHRLSRGGDRQLNRALHTVALHRRQHDPQTKDYIARRIAEGKSRRDATRLLKRYLARHLYRLLQQQAPQMT